MPPWCAALKAGSRGYLHKNCGVHELRDALEQLRTTGYYYTPLEQEARAANEAQERGREKVLEALSPHELELVRLLCDNRELPYKLIAAELGIALRTLRRNCSALYEKFRGYNARRAGAGGALGTRAGARCAARMLREEPCEALFTERLAACSIGALQLSTECVVFRSVKRLSPNGNSNCPPECVVFRSVDGSLRPETSIVRRSASCSIGWRLVPTGELHCPPECVVPIGWRLVPIGDLNCPPECAGRVPTTTACPTGKLHCLPEVHSACANRSVRSLCVVRLRATASTTRHQNRPRGRLLKKRRGTCMWF